MPRARGGVFLICGVDAIFNNAIVGPLQVMRLQCSGTMLFI